MTYNLGLREQLLKIAEVDSNGPRYRQLGISSNYLIWIHQLKIVLSTIYLYAYAFLIASKRGKGVIDKSISAPTFYLLDTNNIQLILVVKYQSTNYISYKWKRPLAIRIFNQYRPSLVCDVHDSLMPRRRGIVQGSRQGMRGASDGPPAD